VLLVAAKAHGQMRNLKPPRLFLRPARGSAELAAELKRFNSRHLRA
jgi:hypothetical protein